jgi:hypothetical protein
MCALLVTRVRGQTTAMLYRPVAPGGKTEPVEFTSPVNRIRFDRVENVSTEVALASSVVKDETASFETGAFEFSIRLSVLGLQTIAGQSIRGDLGILRGNGFQTVRRVYWNKKPPGSCSTCRAKPPSPHVSGAPGSSHGRSRGYSEEVRGDRAIGKGALG